MTRDLESRDLEGAAHFAAADAEPPEPPHPSEYEEDGLYACPTCGENVTRYGRRCPRCERNLEEDRLERESGR